MSRFLSRTTSFIGVLLLAVVSLGTFAIAGYLALESARLKSGAVKASGTVVKLERVTTTHSSVRRYRRSDPPQTSITWTPVFEFTNSDGSTNRVQSSTSSSPARYKVGDRIPILYSPENPQGARIDSFASLWLGPIMLGRGGLVFALIACFTLVRHVRKGR